MRPPPASDQADPFARFRAEFHLPPGKIYLDGNSLGPLSRRAESALQRVLGEWRTLGINGWTDAAPPWVTLSEHIAAQLAPLVGAAPGDIAVTGSTTGNLHQLLATLFDLAGPRKVILGDELNFPSDAHALASHLRQRGLDPARHLREVRSRDGRTLHEDDIVAAFTPDVQLAVLPAVLYVSGQLLDITWLTREAHARGILIGWDCSHSIGAVPHALAASGADFAFWCSYKYLNAGPGAVGGLYLHRRHHARAPGLAGWWGVRAARRFAMSHTHEPAADAAALHVGTPHVLSLAPLQGSLELFAEAGGVEPLRAKSLTLTRALIELADTELAGFGFRVVTPREDARRGGHVALAHPQAWQFCSALKAAGVVPDFRPPDIIRLAPAPLYNTFADCAEAVARLAQIARTKAHEQFPAQPAAVT
ncbi:MAG: kynureninase [Opitutae bacterium]|nr:kynureninase [Opitutae bacterium]